MKFVRFKTIAEKKINKQTEERHSNERPCDTNPDQKKKNLEVPVLHSNGIVRDR